VSIFFSDSADTVGAVDYAKRTIAERLNGNGAELLTALNKNNLIVVDRLLNAKDTALSVRDTSFGKTALIIAAQKRFRSVVQRMCELILEGVTGAESSINAQDNEGYTALMWASLRGHTEICAVLLAYGARIDLVNSTRKTALELATHSGVIQLLSPQSSPQSRHSTQSVILRTS